MVFHLSLSDSKFIQVSRTPLSILVDLNIVVVIIIINIQEKNSIKKWNYEKHTHTIKIINQVKRKNTARILFAKRKSHAGHCWRSRDELIGDALLWTPTYGPAKAGRPARTYIQQLCEDMGYSPEDMPEAMNDREK